MKKVWKQVTDQKSMEASESCSSVIIEQLDKRKINSKFVWFFGPHKWVVCLSFDVAQVFQHDMYRGGESYLKVGGKIYS